MNKNKIQNNYKEKISYINKLNKFYYDKNKPLVSDLEYDDLKSEILKLESEHKFLKSKISPSQNVGYKASKNLRKYYIEHQCSLLPMRFLKMI